MKQMPPFKIQMANAFSFWGGTLGILVAAAGVARAEHAPAVGTTRIAQWRGDRQAAFTMEFDDGDVSHLCIVIPELQKRKMVGTFFLNPGKAENRALISDWREAPKTGAAVLGDHTMTHCGFKDRAGAEVEIGQAQKIVMDMVPGKQPRLLAFATPGVGAGRWPITGAEQKEILAEYNLVDRGNYAGHGAMFHQRTADEMVALADSALSKGGVEYIVFHAIGKGTIPTPVPIFMDFLDKLESRRDRLWLTDVVSAHQYAAERSSGEVRLVEADSRQIRLSLTSKVDAQFYDAPLTLVTQVAPGWLRCQVTQNAIKTTATVVNGTVRFDAMPNAGAITLDPL